MIKGSVLGSCRVPPALAGRQQSCRWPAASRSGPGAFGASRQGIAEVCAGLAYGMAGAAVLELSASWKAAPALPREPVSPRLLSLPRAPWICVPAPLCISLARSSSPGGACLCVRLHRSKEPPAWWGQEPNPLSCAVVCASQPPQCLPKCSHGGARSAGSGRVELPSPQWVLGVLTPSSAVPAHGESQALHALLFEGFNCSTRLKI